MAEIECAKEAMDALRIIAKEKSLTFDKLAATTGISRQNIGKLLKGTHLPRLDTYIKLYEAITGKKFEV